MSGCFRIRRPDVPEYAEGIIGGRNIRDGYARGWGIRHGNLVEKVQNDQDFINSYNDMAGRSIIVYEKLVNIFLIIKFYIPSLIREGSKYSIIEFGCYRGGSAIFMASLCKSLDLPVDVYGLDTFSGMPKTNKTFDAHSEGDFKEVNLEELIQYKDSIGLNNLFYIKGLFSDTAPNLLRRCGEVLLAHIDCDIYEAVKYSYDIIQPKMIKGGYYIFDDATEPSCIGATFAVEENVIRRDKKIPNRFTLILYLGICDN